MALLFQKSPSDFLITKFNALCFFSLPRSLSLSLPPCLSCLYRENCCNWSPFPRNSSDFHDYHILLISMLPCRKHLLSLFHWLLFLHLPVNENIAQHSVFSHIHSCLDDSPGFKLADSTWTLLAMPTLPSSRPLY